MHMITHELHMHSAATPEMTGSMFLDTLQRRTSCSMWILFEFWMGTNFPNARKHKNFTHSAKRGGGVGGGWGGVSLVATSSEESQASPRPYFNAGCGETVLEFLA